MDIWPSGSAPHFIILGTGANNFILGELMWPVDPVAIKSLKFDNEIYLIVYSTISVDIFDVLKGLIFPRLRTYPCTYLEIREMNLF